MILQVDRLDTPLGTLHIATGDRPLVRVDFEEDDDRFRNRLALRFGAEAILREVDDPNGFTSTLAAYFAGDEEALGDLPIDPGGTLFQQRVWAELCRIPHGETISYGQLAQRINQPKASRAVGMANSRNPISIVVPCHRVIGASGKLTGYASGVARKRWLLEHEGAIAREFAFA